MHTEKGCACGFVPPQQGCSTPRATSCLQHAMVAAYVSLSMLKGLLGRLHILLAARHTSSRSVAGACRRQTTQI